MSFCIRPKLPVSRVLSLPPFRTCSPASSRTLNQCMSRARASSTMLRCSFREAKALHTSAPLLDDDLTVKVETEYQTVTLKGSEGDSILDVIKKSEYGFEGFGACDGTTTCSTCHIYFDEATFDAVNKGISDDELDMLCIVEEKKPTSRLGCQVKLTKEVDGMTVILPLLHP